MLIPNKKKYKSVRRIKNINFNRRVISSLQLDCYKGHLPMKCGYKCPLHKDCWFNGLKPCEV